MLCSAPSCRPDWSALPENAQVAVLALLSPAALRRARLACKTWAQLTPAPAVLAGKQTLTVSGPLAETEQDLRAALERCPGLTRLTLRQPVSNAALATLAADQPNLAHLVCCLCNQPACWPQLATLAALTALRTLHVVCLDSADSCSRPVPPPLELAGLAGLVSLRLTGTCHAFPPENLAAASGLTELQLVSGLHDEAPLDTVALAAALAELTRLRSLQLGGDFCANEHALVQLSRLTGLTRLRLPSSLRGGPWLCQALWPLRDLQDLATSSWSSVREQYLAVALAQLTAVTRLSVAFSGLVGEVYDAVSRLLHVSVLRLCAVVLPDPAHLQGVARLPALTALALSASISHGQMTVGQGQLAAAMEHLAAATGLRQLSLDTAWKRPAVAVTPPHLAALTQLALHQPGDVAVWLPALAAQLPRLTALALTLCSAPGGGALATHLSACTALTQLQLRCGCFGNHCFDGAGLPWLELLPKVVELHLLETNSAPSAAHPRQFVRDIARCRTLRLLTLQGVLAGDQECEVLAAACSLECVTFRQGDPERAPQQCRPPSGGPGLAALLGGGCRVVYEDYEPASGAGLGPARDAAWLEAVSIVVE